MSGPEPQPYRGPRHIKGATVAGMRPPTSPPRRPTPLLTVEPVGLGDRSVELWAYVPYDKTGCRDCDDPEQRGVRLDPDGVRQLIDELARRLELIEAAPQPRQLLPYRPAIEAGRYLPAEKETRASGLQEHAQG